MCNWVANYEISDFFKAKPHQVTFFRYNQYPERDASTFEEKERMIEEKPFGGEAIG